MRNWPNTKYKCDHSNIKMFQDRTLRKEIRYWRAQRQCGSIGNHLLQSKGIDSRGEENDYELDRKETKRRNNEEEISTSNISKSIYTLLCNLEIFRYSKLFSQVCL